jgi:hypothetical protein
MIQNLSDLKSRQIMYAIAFLFKMNRIWIVGYNLYVYSIYFINYRQS